MSIIFRTRTAFRKLTFFFSFVARFQSGDPLPDVSADLPVETSTLTVRAIIVGCALGKCFYLLECEKGVVANQKMSLLSLFF